MPLDIFQGLKAVQAPRDPDPRPPPVGFEHPELSPDGRALWDGLDGWVWVLPETDGEEWYFTIDAEGPVPEWVDWIMEGGWGIGGALFDGCYSPEDFAKALMAEGIAPDQPFFIHIWFRCGIDYSQSGMGEGWDETDWRLIDVEPLPPEEIAARWERWIRIWYEDFWSPGVPGPEASP